MLVVIPVVAILSGRGLLVGVDLILTPDMARPELSALPGLEAVLFSREIPRTGQPVSGLALCSLQEVYKGQPAPLTENGI